MSDSEAVLEHLENIAALCVSRSFSELDPEMLIAAVADFLRIPENDDEALALKRASMTGITILRQVAQMTWYRCGCGPISPLSGIIDVMCDKCGELRRLPPRLSRAPWPMAVACYRRLNPTGWFDDLSAGMMAEHTGVIESGAYPQDSAAGGDAYSAQPNSGAGDIPPKMRIIRCSDGMIIAENGEIKGLSWIALPIPAPHTI